MKVAIVNDSLMALEALRRTISLDPSLEICWIAANGKDAVQQCEVMLPDLILMDLYMPVMDGVEATRQIMKATPCQILIVTASVTTNAAKVFDAMGAGALDAVAVPVLDGSKNNTDKLLKKIDTIGKLAGFRSGRSGVHETPYDTTEHECRTNCGSKLVAIGCSTGGPHAALKILSSFPANFPAAFVLVQHMDERFTNGLAKWLNQQLKLQVRILKENDRLQPGIVLVPSARAHIILKANGRIGYLNSATNGGHYLPSVDVFFKSVAKRWCGKSVGVLLTGMGRDGAEGLLAMRKQGMFTIAQNRETCVVFGMPKAAIELNAAQSVLPLDLIGEKIHTVMMQKG